DIDFEMEFLDNQLAQRPAIAVLHPSVGADETKLAAGGKAIQRSLDERNVEVSAIVHCGIAGAVFRDQDVRDQLLADIRRIADHHIEAAGKRHQKKIPVEQPLSDQSNRIVSVNS